LGIRAGFQHLRGFLACDEVQPGWIALDAYPFHVGKGVFPDEAFAQGRAEELLGHAAAPPYRVFPEVGEHVPSEFVGIARGDVGKGSIRTEVVDQVSGRHRQVPRGLRFGIGSTGDVLLKPSAERHRRALRRRLPRRHQSDRGQLAV
jgi:hypothetical protein